MFQIRPLVQVLLVLKYFLSITSEAAQSVTHLAPNHELPVLVLGSGGLIGRPLVKALIDANYTVLEVEGRRTLDLRVAGALEQHFRDVDIGFVFLLAWDVGGSGYIYGSPRSQSAQLRSNAALMLHTMTWLEDRRLPFIYTGSSMELLSDGERFLSAYAEAKRMCSAWAARIPTAVTVRLWNVYGPVEDAAARSADHRAHVLTDWTHKCLSHEENDVASDRRVILIDSRTDGNELRQMMYAEDAATVLVRLMRIHGRLPSSEAIDLASGQWLSLRTLAFAFQESLELLRGEISSLPHCEIQFAAVPAKVSKGPEPRLEATANLVNMNGGEWGSMNFITVQSGIQKMITSEYATENKNEEESRVQLTSETCVAPLSLILPRTENSSLTSSVIWSALEEAQNTARSGRLDVAKVQLIKIIARVTAFGVLPDANGQDPAFAHSALYNDLGLVLMWLGELEEAKTSFITSLWISPWSGAAKDNLDIVLARIHSKAPFQSRRVARIQVNGNPFCYSPRQLWEKALNDMSNNVVYKPDAVRMMALALVRSVGSRNSAYTTLSEDFAVLLRSVLSETSVGRFSNDYAELFMCGLQHIRLASRRKQPAFANIGLHRWYEAQLRQLKDGDDNDRYIKDDLAGCEKRLATGVLPPGDSYELLLQEARSLVRMRFLRDATVMYESAIASQNQDREVILSNKAVLAAEVQALEAVVQSRTVSDKLEQITISKAKESVLERSDLSQVECAIQDHAREVAKARDTNEESELFLVAEVNKNIGIGNRLLSLVGALALAIATRRTLLIHWPHEYRYGEPPSRLDDLFDLPAELAGIYDPVALSAHIGISIQDMPLHSSFVELFQDQEEGGSDLAVFDYLACDNLPETRGGNARIMYLHTNQEISAILRYNRHLPWMAQQDAFSVLARSLIRPAKCIRAAADAWLARWGKIHLSVHIRLGIPGHDVIGGRVLSAEEVDRKRESTLQESIKSTVAVVRKLQQEDPDLNDPPFVFLATDDAFIRQAGVKSLREDFGIQAAAYDDSLLPEDVRLGKGLPLVAVDFFLVSLGQHILRREFSTFSMVAGAVGGIVPHLFVPCNSTKEGDLAFTVFREKHSSGRLGTNLDNLERSPAKCYGGPGVLAKKMLGDGFLYPSCLEFDQIM